MYFGVFCALFILVEAILERAAKKKFKQEMRKKERIAQWTESDIDAKGVVWSFVEGHMDAQIFEHFLYNDPKTEEFLRDPSVNWHDTFVTARATDLYHYLIELVFHVQSIQ